MALKAFVKKLEEVPEKYRELYKEDPDNGGFSLETDDTSYKAKLSEFRSNNIKLAKIKDELEAKMEQFKDVDPEEYRTLKEQMLEVDKLQDAAALKAGKWEDVITKRIDAVKKDLSGKLTAAELRAKAADEAAKTYRDKHRDLRVRTAITEAVMEVANPRPGALQYIHNTALPKWNVDENDNLVPADDLINTNGAPMSVKEFAQSMVTQSPYLFEQGGGSGAPGSKGKARSAGPKIISRNDPLAIGRNLEAIVKGDVQVESADSDSEG